MKTTLILFALCTIPGIFWGQKKGENFLSVKVDGEELQTQPRKVNLGKFVYYTGNINKPETMIRVWLGNFSGETTTETGQFLVVDGNNPPSKKEIKNDSLMKKYKGIAVIRYVKETKSPRMTYHVGDSRNKNEIVNVTITDDDNLKISFEVELFGTHWKEKGAATVIGGVGRLQDKVESKVMSKATGFDWNIDPEGNGYRKLDETDTIQLSEGVITIKLESKNTENE